MNIDSQLVYDCSSHVGHLLQPTALKVKVCIVATVTMRPLFALSIVLVGVATQVYGLMGTPTVTIVTNSSLLDLLCGSEGGPSSNTIYELTSSQPYIIPQGDFCVTENVTNVTILGNDSTTDSPTMIKCLSKVGSSLSRRGFAFINAHSLSLANIVFEGCGAILTEEVLREGNSSLLYFDPGEAAVLVCNSCRDFILLRVHITSYVGRAIVGIDVFGRSRLDSVVVSDNTATHQDCETRFRFSVCKGSGIVWLYTNTTDKTGAEETEFTIINSKFSNNRAYTLKSQDVIMSCADTLADSFFAGNSSFEPASIPSVGAMTLLHQQYSPVKVSFFNSNFTSNQGLCFGAILVIYLSEAAYNSLYFSGCTFSNNRQVLPSGQFRGRYFGSTVTLYMKYLGNYSRNDDCIVVTDSHFVVDSEEEQTFSTSRISLVQFPDNTGYCMATMHNVTGGNIRLLYALTLSAGDSLDIALSNIYLTGSTIDDSLSLGAGDGLLTFSYVNRVLIADSVFFQLTGPIVFGEASYVVFSGNVTFGSAIGSTWTSGAAMYLRGGSIIWLMEPLSLTFYNNTAFKGGAIYSVSQYAEYCAIQFTTEREYDEYNIGDIDIAVTFISNSARIAGNSMYIRPLNMCSIRLSSTIRNVNPSVVYDKVFEFRNSVENGLLEISSTPIQICLCSEDLNNTNRSALKCDGDSIPRIDTFPGKTFSFSIVPIDESFNRVYSLVYNNPRHEPSPNMTQLNWQLGYGEDIVQAYGSNCTTFTFTLLSGYVGDSANGSIAMYPSESIEGLFVPVIVFNCPPGFELVEGADTCSCPAFLEDRGVRCNVSSGLVTRPGTSWIGIAEYIENFTVLTAEDIDLGFSDHCPTRYCNQSESMVNVSEDSLCLLGRTGVLCGQCRSGLSVTIGSPECHRCSNWWLFTLPLYALLGVAIVILLLLLQLTVAQGTINGLIFYANILSVSTYYLFGFKGAQWSLIFISFLNLELGFPVCLFDGLDDIIKAILSIAFPIYIWLIAIGLVYASRFSHRLAQLTSQSAVPVLATLIYITYYELLRFSVDGLAFSTIHRQKDSDDIVWYYDGNVGYLRDYKHVCLFCLVLIVVCAFILPYAILLTGIRFFSRFRIINKFRPLIDAYCAPYKDKYRFWFGLRIWVLVAIYILFAGLRNTPQILFLCQCIVLILFILAQVAVMPFKNVIINWLDLFFMTNALLLSLVALHGVSLGIQITSGLSVAAALVVFCCIVGYHAWKRWKRVKVDYEERKYALNADRYKPMNEPITQTSLIISDSRECGSHYQQFVNIHPSKFRDSILEESVTDVTESP